MRQRHIRAILASGVTLCVLGFSTVVSAQSFSLRSQNAEGQGMAFAGASAGSIGIGSIYFNPAAATLYEGRRSSFNLTYTLPRAEYEVLSRSNPGIPGGNTGNIGLDGAITPASYQSWQLTDRLWVGLYTGAPWGLRSKPENYFNAAQFYGRTSSLRTINVSPSFAYKVTEWFSIGAALQVQYAKARLTGAYPTLAANPFIGTNSGILQGDNTSVGYKVGALFNLSKDTTLGVGFHSMIHHELTGELEVPNNFPGRTPAGTYPIKVNLNLPERLNVGFSHRFNEQWQVHLTGEWMNWSRFGRLPVVRQDTGLPASSLNFVYKDSYHAALGVEYTLNPQWTFRAGVAHDWSPVSDDVRGVRISDANRFWTSVGATYRYSEQLSFDVGYSHLWVKDAPVNIVPGHPDFVAAFGTYQAVAKPKIDVFSFGVNYRWDTPSKPIPAITTKG